MAAEDRAELGLGKAIELRRIELDLKRRELAERAHLSYPYISEIENGVKEPSAKAQRQIAEALELTVSELAALSERIEDRPADSRSILFDTPPGRASTAAQSSPTTAENAPLSASSPSVVRATSHSTSHQRLAGRPETPDYLLARSGTASRPRDSSEHRAVREQLDIWVQAELPDIVRREVARQLAMLQGDERGLGDEDG